MTRKIHRGNVNYIEVTRERYFYVTSAFKYKCLDNDGEKHYYLARNRKALDDDRNELSNRKRLDDWLEERGGRR